MNIRELIQYGCDEAGVPELSAKIMVEWNNRFTKRAGDANYYTNKGYGRIRLSSKLWPTMTVSVQENLVLHEVAHVIDIYKHGISVKDIKGGHGYTWRQIAEKIGAKPERYMDYNEAAFSTYKRKVVRYTYICQGCGKQLSISQNLITRMKKGKKYCCIKCRTSIEV